MCPTPYGQGLAGGSSEHWESKTSLGALGEVSEEVGSRPDSCIKILPSGVPGCASFCGRNVVIDGNDAANTVGGTHEFLEAGGRDVGA